VSDVVIRHRFANHLDKSTSVHFQISKLCRQPHS